MHTLLHFRHNFGHVNKCHSRSESNHLKGLCICSLCHILPLMSWNIYFRELNVHWVTASYISMNVNTGIYFHSVPLSLATATSSLAQCLIRQFKAALRKCTTEFLWPISWPKKNIFSRLEWEQGESHKKRREVKKYDDMEWHTVPFRGFVDKTKVLHISSLKQGICYSGVFLWGLWKMRTNNERRKADKKS